MEQLKNDIYGFKNEQAFYSGVMNTIINSDLATGNPSTSQINEIQHAEAQAKQYEDDLDDDLD